MSEDMAETQRTPSGWRDVYALVSDVERRLTEALKEYAEESRGKISDHEARIRIIETNGTYQAQVAKALAEANQHRIDNMERQDWASNARREGQTGILTATHKTIIFIFATIATLGVLFDIVYHLAN